MLFNRFEAIDSFFAERRRYGDLVAAEVGEADSYFVGGGLATDTEGENIVQFLREGNGYMRTELSLNTATNIPRFNQSGDNLVIRANDNSARAIDVTITDYFVNTDAFTIYQNNSNQLVTITVNSRGELIGVDLAT